MCVCASPLPRPRYLQLSLCSFNYAGCISTSEKCEYSSSKHTMLYNRMLVRHLIHRHQFFEDPWSRKAHKLSLIFTPPAFALFRIGMCSGYCFIYVVRLLLQRGSSQRGTHTHMYTHTHTHTHSHTHTHRFSMTLSPLAFALFQADLWSLACCFRESYCLLQAYCFLSLLLQRKLHSTFQRGTQIPVLDTYYRRADFKGMLPGHCFQRKRLHVREAYGLWPLLLLLYLLQPTTEQPQGFLWSGNCFRKSYIPERRTRYCYLLQRSLEEICGRVTASEKATFQRVTHAIATCCSAAWKRYVAG